MTGNAPNGDCWRNENCTGTNNSIPVVSEAPRQTLDYCEDNGYLSLKEFYTTANGICYSIEQLRNLYPRVSNIEGDPHIKTWGGKWFDYHGECDLVMIDAPEFEQDVGLRVHVRTTIRYDYSFIEAAAVQLGDDVLEVESYGEYSWNGIARVDLEDAMMSRFPIHYTKKSEKQHSFDIVVGKNENITISTFKDLVSVKVTSGNIHHFRYTHGLMGSWTGHLMARDGVTEMSMEDPNAFGQEWQVRADEPQLFRVARAPQASDFEKCKLPEVGGATMPQRRLGEAAVNSRAAEVACSHLEGIQKDNCVFDVIALGDLNLAGAY